MHSRLAIGFTLLICATSLQADDRVVAVILDTNIVYSAIHVEPETSERMKKNMPPKAESEEVSRKYLLCAQAHRLYTLVESTLYDHFIEEHGLSVSPADIDTYMHYTGVAPIEWKQGRKIDDIPEDPMDEELRLHAESELLSWKFNNTLYDLYGGPVVVDVAFGPYPACAFQRYLEEAEQKRLFEIHDDALRDGFWACHAMRNDALTQARTTDDASVLRAYPANRHLRKMADPLERLLNASVEEFIKDYPGPPDWPETTVADENDRRSHGPDGQM